MQARHEGRIRAGGVEKDVTFVDVGDELNDEIDAAYREKYDHHSAASVDSMTSPEARSATIRLEPRADA